ncbi:MAG: hypothetical protein EON58_22190, partial [Alphaproteobacteria bacterium]
MPLSEGLLLFLEKFSRFLRMYDLRFSPRHTGAPYLPLDGGAKNFSVRDALQKWVQEEKALVVQPNGDVVELMAVDFRNSCLVLLFHRASPNAADPAYRRKARQKAGVKVTVRNAVKELDEEQSVSAHLVISNDKVSDGVYRAALEEIPGLSMGPIREIVALALNSYQYDFMRGKKKIDTYTVFRPEGLKSETITNALKKGEIGFVTLSRQAKAPFVDADGIFKPTIETMKLRVTGEITSKNWRDTLGQMVGSARKAGWPNVNVDIGLDNNRKRTVQLDRDDEAKEVLFEEDA